MPYGSDIVKKNERIVAAILAFLMTSSLLIGLPLNASANSSFADAFGYYWIDSNAPSPTVNYNWIEINATGNDTGLVDTDPDDWHGPFAIGFSFPFYGNQYSQLNISTKGMVTFDFGTNDWSNDPIPNMAFPDNFIAAYWDDLRPSNGYIYYQTMGVAPNRQFVIEWWNISYYSDQIPDSTFEIILNETGEIWLQYQTMDPSMIGQSATVGIENIDGTIGLQYSYDSAVLSNNLAISILPPAVTIGPDQSTVGARSSDVSFLLQVDNLQGVADSFDINTSSALGWTVTLFDSSGIVPLTDTNGDPSGLPDTGNVPAYSSVTITVTISIPASPTASPDTVVVTAISFLNNLHLSSATLMVYVQSVFLPPHTDSARDVNGDGYYDWIVLTPQVDIGAPGNYYIEVWLYDSGWGFIGYTFNLTTFSAGINTLNLMIPGYLVNASKDNGPYNVNMNLYDAAINWLDSDTFTTNVYLWVDFQGPAEFLPPHSDSGLDTNGDSTYNELVVDVVVNVTVAGTYTIRGQLLDSFSTLIDSNQNMIWLAAGIQIVQLRFNGWYINENGVDGPYTVELELLIGATLQDTDTHITAAYPWTAFDPLPARFIPPWYDDFEYGTLGGSTGYNWTTTAAGLSGVGTYTSASGTSSMYTRGGVVSVTSWYIDLSGLSQAEVRCWIQRGSDAFSEDPDFGEDLVIEYLNVSLNWNILETFVGNGLPGEILVRNYTLPADALHADFQLLFRQTGGSGGGSDYWHIDDVYVGDPLLLPTFEPPHNDYGISTDADMLFDYLIVEAMINATVPGTYRVVGILLDSMLNEITRIENITGLVAGVQAVNLSFNGSSIYFYGANGPYQVNLLLFDTTVGMLVDSDTYFTGAYLWTDFDPPTAFAPPWYDDFESGLLGGTTGYNWTTTDATSSGVGTFTAHSGTYSMYLTGGGLSVTSWYIDLSGLSQAEVRCWIQRGSDAFSEDPDTGEDLTLEYMNATGSWILLETFPGGGAPGEVMQRTYALPADGLHAGFQLRFTHVMGSGTGTDYWHIDDVYVGGQMALADLTPPYSETATDDNSNGLYDWLIVHVPVDVSVAGTYHLTGDMYDGFANFIASNTNSTYLTVGMHTVDLMFYGGDINTSGLNGPYTIQLELVHDFWGPTDSDSHITAAYLWSDFESPNNPPVADFTVTPAFGTFSTVFFFDAMSSWDWEDPDTALEMRWDWENDGTWDTSWAQLGTATHQYSTSGTLTIRLQVRDTVGQMSSHFDSVTVDGTPPVTTAVYGGALLNGWYSTDVTVTLNAVDGFIGVNSTYFRNGTAGQWTVYSTPFDLTTEGQNTLQYYSDDLYDNVETVHTDMIWIDKTDPTTTASGYQYNVTLTASDNVGGSGVNRTMFRIDAGSWQTYSGMFSAGSSGTHNVTFYSVDEAGNTETIKWVLVPIADNTDPNTVVDLDGTLGLNGWYISDVTVTLNATDAGSGVDYTNYRIDSGSWETYTGAFDVSANGEHSLEYYSVDIASNTESTNSQSIKVDKAAPSLVLSQSNGTSFAQNNVVIVWVATDVTSGIDDILISVDGGSFESIGNASSVSLEDLAIGDHTIVIRAVDEAGLMTEKTLEFVVASSAGGLALDWTLLLIIIVAIAAGILILFLVMKRRKKKEPEQAPMQGQTWQTAYPPPPPPPPSQ